MDRKKVKKILDELEKEYPDAECALVHDNVFQLLIATILSAQTTDVSVNKVTPSLFKKYPTPQDLSLAEEKEVSEYIRSIGMYKTKAKNIIGTAKSLVKNFDGIVPKTYEDLQSLPGVGRKTANVVMSVGFNIPAIAVDTHVFRVSNRIGLVDENNVLKTEEALMKTIPKKRWSRTHHSLIFHGRNCCIARKPKCGECCIEYLCMKRL